MQLQEFKSAWELMKVCESLLKAWLSRIPTSWMSSEMRNECDHQHSSAQCASPVWIHFTTLQTTQPCSSFALQFNFICLVTSIEKAYLVSSQVSSGPLIYLNTHTQHLIYCSSLKHFNTFPWPSHLPVSSVLSILCSDFSISPKLVMVRRNIENAQYLNHSLHHSTQETWLAEFPYQLSIWMISWTVGTFLTNKPRKLLFLFSAKMPNVRQGSSVFA